MYFCLPDLFHLEHDHSHDHLHSKISSPVDTPISAIENGEATQPSESRLRPAGSRPLGIGRRTRERSDSYSSLYGHPAATRASFVQTANDLATATSPSNRNKRFSLPHSRSTHDTHGLDNVVDDVAESSVENLNPDATERTPLLRHASEQTAEHATIINEAWTPTSSKRMSMEVR